MFLKICILQKVVIGISLTKPFLEGYNRLPQSTITARLELGACVFLLFVRPVSQGILSAEDLVPLMGN